LTHLLKNDARVLYADFGKYAGRWYVQKDLEETACPEDIVAEVPRRDLSRIILARFGSHYMGGQLYGGFVEGIFRQRGKSHYVAIYMANDARRGFWFRAFASAGEPEASPPDQSSE
jgi:hypothetical protein